MQSIQDTYPLRIVVNGEDVTDEVQEGFTFSNTDPGGFEACSLPLAKDKPQLKRGDPIRIECGLQTAWEGRIKEVQRSLGAKTLIQGEGNRAILAENLMAEIFVDRDLTRWEPMPLARQAIALAEKLTPGAGELTAGSVGEPSIVTAVTGPWSAAGLPFIESWFDSHGIPLGVLYFHWERNANVSAADINWEWFCELKVAGALGAGDTSGNLRAAGPGANYLTATTSDRVIAFLEFRYLVEAGAANVSYAVNWAKLAVYGKGFRASVYSTGRGADPVGYYPSQIAAYAASQCPGIQVGTVEEASQYTVPHASYLTPVPIEQIISDMAKAAGWHWGVWESRAYLTGSQTPRVDFRAGPGEGEPTAWCWRRECESVDVRENIESLYDSAKVGYTDPGGIERSVEVSLANPALESVGLHRQANLSLGAGTTAAAEAWGLIQLRLLADQARMTGSVTITEPVHTMSGAPMAPWMLRAGLDRLRIPDLPCSDVWGAHNDLPITRVECSSSSAGLTTHVELGNSVNLIETLAAQLQANVTAAG
jgi:hypothetical protein